MKFPLFPIIVLTVVLVATHADLSPEMYWKSMLPNTPMPGSFKELLPPTGAGTSMALIFFNLNRIKDIDGVIKTLPFPAYKRQINIKLKSHLLNNSNETIFFLEKDLKAGHKMNLLFMNTSINHASFLPREVVKSIPFSSTKMAEILNKFGVKRGSVAAELMKTTITICEEPRIKGEEKYCATSLESMVDFVTLKLGKSVKALSIEMMNQTKQEEYEIMHGVKKVGETQVVCHKLNYGYAVFYCHKIENTIAYTVPLEAAGGTRMKALCVCHKDTSDWNPKHLAFELLKVKPGTVPVCHFLYQGTVMWVPKQN